jgi:hypothetical protein
MNKNFSQQPAGGDAYQHASAGPLGLKDKMQKYVYLLEHHATKQPVNLGVFTSLAKAKRFLKALSRKHAYAIYRLPTNTCLTQGRKMKDVQGLFDHWHYGTDITEQVDTDEKDHVVRRRKRRMLTWPE